MSSLVAGLITLVLGVIYWIFGIKSKLKQSNEDNARLTLEKDMHENVFRFDEAKKEGETDEDTYRRLRDAYINSKPDGDGPAGAA